MGVLRQLGQLIWKNLILRKREPHVLAIELLWPLMMFIIVALIRYGAPPKEVETCSYQERPMPSSGMFPFLQSTVCNLQNSCEEPSTIAKKTQSASRLSALISDMEPYLTDPKTIQAMRTINVSVKVVKSLKEVSDNGSLGGIIDEVDGYTVKKFFKDPDKVYEIMVSDLKILSPNVTKALLDSTVNVITLFDMFGGVDLKSIVCDEDLFKKYMIFKKDVDVALVSKELCALNDSKIPYITDMVQKQLDVAALIRMGKSLTALTNSYELSDALEDMAVMTDLLYNSPAISGMLNMVNEDMLSLLSKLPTWINAITELQGLDTSSIDAIMEFIKPLIAQETDWSPIENITSQLKEMADGIGSGSNVDWTTVMEKGIKLAELLGGNNTDFTWLKVFAGMPVEEMTNMTTALFSGNLHALQNMSKEQIMFYEKIMQQFLGKNATMQIIALTDRGLDMGILVVSYLSEMDRNVERMLKENGHLLSAVDKIFKMGPNVTTVVWGLLFETDFFMDLAQSPLDVSKCKELLQKGVSILGYSVVMDIQNTVCTANVTMAINKMVEMFNATDIQTKIEMSVRAFDMVLQGKLPQPPPTLQAVHQKYLTFSHLFNYLTMQSLNARWIDTTKNMLGSSQTVMDWNPMVTVLGPTIVQASWPSMMVMIGSAIENSTMWKTVGPFVRSMDVSMDFMMNQMKTTKDMMNESTSMGQLIKYATEYSPEIVTAVMSMDQTMMQEIMASPDPTVLFCYKKILSQMGMPSYVPVTEMESFLCKTNWTNMVMEMSAAYNMEPLMQQIGEIFKDTNTVIGPFDWKGMVSKTQEMMNMMQDTQSLSMSGPWNIIAKLNFTRLGEAFVIALSKMGNMQATDLSMMFVSTMSQLEMSMQNMTIWRGVKLYVKMGDAYNRFFTKYLIRTNDTVDLQHLLSNISKTFGEFVTKSASTMPDFLEALKNTTVNPFTFILKMFTKFNSSTPCDGNMLADIFGVSSSSVLGQYEHHLCTLNWTAVLMEMMQHDPDLKEYIELQMIMSTYPMEHWPDLAVNWTKVAINSQQFYEALSTYNMQNAFLGSTLSSLDLQRLNVSWEKLVDSLNALQNMDNVGQYSDGFMSLLKMLSGSSNSSSDDFMKQMEVMGAIYQYQSYTVLRFMNIHLSYINKTGFIDLKAYLKSDEFNKILDNIAASPDISAAGLQTMLDMMSDLNKANYIVQSWDKICSNLTVFKSIVTTPAGSSLDLSTLQSGLCGLNLNFTKLIMELSTSLQGFSQVLQALTMDSTVFDMKTMYVNHTTIQKESKELELLISYLVTHPPTVSLGISENWMNFTIYEEQWNNFLQKLSTELVPANLAQIQGPGWNMALKGLTAIPEFNSILQYISLYMTFAIEKFNQTTAGFEDPLAAYKGYPNLQKVVALMDDIPHLYVVWSFNSMYYTDKIMNILSLKSWEEFCGLSGAALPVNLPGSTFDVATFHNQLCAVNMTAFLIESSRYQGMEQIQKLLSSNITKEVDLSKLSAQMTELTRLLLMSANTTDPNTMVVPDYLNMTVWEMALDQLTTAISDPQLLVHVSYHLTRLALSLVDQNYTSTAISTMYSVIDVVLDKLDMLSNNSIINIDELLAKDPETKKLWVILQKPGVLETLMYSSNTAKFNQLLMNDNVTEIMMLLCGPGSLGAFLTVPPNVNLDLGQLKTELCNVNMEKLPQEFMDDIGKALAQVSDNTTSVNWTVVTEQHLRLQAWINRWIATPPTIRLPMAWQNMSFWVDLLTKYSQANMVDPSNMMDPANITKQIQNMLFSMKPLFSEEPMKSFGVFFESYLPLLLTQSVSEMNWRNMTLSDIVGELDAAMKNTSEWKFVRDFMGTGRIIVDIVDKLLTQVLKQGSTLDLATLFQNSTTLKNLLTSTGGLSEDLVTGLFSGYIKQGKIADFLSILENNKLPEFLCDESQWQAIFSFPSSFNVTTMKQALCGVNETTIMKEIVAQFQLQPLVEKLMTNMNSGAVDIQGFMTAIQQVSNKMMQAMNISTVGFSWLDMEKLNNLNMTKLNMLLEKELQSVQQLQTELMMQMFEPLLKNSTDAKRMFVIFSFVTAWSKSFMSRLSDDMYKTVTFTNLFGNSSFGSALSSLYRNPVLMDELLKVNVDSQKLMSALTSPNVSQIMCSHMFYEIFTIPGKSTVLPELQQGLCKLGETPLLYDIMAVLLVDHRMFEQLQALMNEDALASLAVNFTQLLDDNNKLTAMLTAFIEASVLPNNFSLSLGTEFRDFFAKLWQLVSRQYTQLLTSSIPVLSDSMSQLMDPSYNKILHTVSLFANYLNTRLAHLTGTVSLNAIFRNSTNIIRVIEAYINVQKHSMVLYSKEYSVEKLMKVSTSPGLLQDLCKNKTLAAYISLGSQTTNIARDIETVMCLDSLAFLDTLGKEFHVNNLNMQLNKIWNSTNVPPIDWKEFNNNLSNLTGLLTELFSNSTVLDRKLVALLDFNITLQSMEMLMQNPDMMWQMVSGLSLDSLGINTMAFEPMLKSWNRMYPVVVKVFKEAQGSGNGSAMMELWKSLSALNTELNTMGESYYRTLYEKMANFTEVQVVVCNRTVLMRYMSFEEAKNVSMAMCGQPGKMWFDRIIQNHVNVEDLHGKLMKAAGKDLKDLATTSWAEFMQQMRNLTLMLQNMNSNQTDRLIQMFVASLSSTEFTNQGVASSLQWMTLLGSDVMMSGQGYLNLLTEVNRYLSQQLNTLHKNGETIPVAVLLPNSTYVAKLLENSLGEQTAAALLTANMNPLKFFELSLSDRWLTVVCNSSLFKDAFMFPAGTDVDRIQRDLCTDAQNQDSVMKEILAKLNVADVSRAFNEFMSGKATVMYNSTAEMLAAIDYHNNLLLANIARIQNLTLNMDGLENWMQPIVLALTNLNNQDPAMLGQTCDKVFSYINATDMYRNTWEPALMAIYSMLETSKQQMEIQTVIEESLCSMDGMNLTTLLQKLIDANVTQLIYNMYGEQNQTSRQAFKCSRLTSLSTELSSLYNASMFRYLTNNATFSQCFTNALKLPGMLLEDTAQTLKVAGQLMEMLSDPAIQRLSKDSDMLAIVQLVLKAYIQQSHITVKLSDLMTNITSVSHFLNDFLKLTPDMISALLNATLKFDGMSLFNKSSASIEAILCDPDKLSKFITLPPLTDLTVANISKMLCSANVASTAKTLMSFMDINTLTLLISQAGTGNVTWWDVMSAHLSEIIGNIQQLYMFSELNIDFNNLDAILPLIQRVIFDDGPEVLAKSINVLLEDFKRLDNDTTTQQLLADLQKIVSGMTSFKVIRNFIPVNVVIGDVAKDRNALKQYLMNDLGLSMQVAEAVLTGSVSYNELMKYNPSSIKMRVCNVTQLQEILNVTAGIVSASDISSALCNLTEAQVVNLTESLLHNLDIGTLVQKYVTSGVGSFLDKFNISTEDAKDSFEKLNAVQDDLKTAANLFSNKSRDLNLNIFNSPEALRGADSVASLSSLLCGNGGDSFEISDSTGASSKMSGTSHLDEEQLAEMKELPGQFCQDLYSEILTTTEGAVIWTYLKPLLRGKILFTPDTPVTRELAERMNKMSFGVLDSVKSYAKDWASGLYEISDLKSDDSILKDVEKFTSGETVSSFLNSALGLSVDDVKKGFDTLNAFDKTQLRQLTNIADLIVKYTGCLESDRFHAVATEEKLLKEAMALGRKGQYLSGIVFNNLENSNRKKRSTNAKLPKHVSYKIRMDIENVRHTNRIKERMWTPDPDDNMVFEMRYLRGFSQLQDIIEQAIIQMQTNQSAVLPVVNLQQFPTACHKHDSYLNYLSMYLLPVLMTFAWLASMAIAARNLVYDRENAQEETLKIMGMRSYLNWWAWFLITMIAMSVSALISVGVLKIGKLFVYTNFGIMLLFFLIFCFSSIMMCYMVSAFFTRTTLAVLTVLIAYLLSYLPYIVLISVEVQMLTWQKVLACLSSTTAFGFGAQYLSRYEIQMEGIHWDNFNKSPMDDDDLSFAWMCYIMLIDAAAYLVIGWYVRSVKPGKYGVSKPWYFPVSPSYWGFRSRASSSKYSPSNSDGVLMDSVAPQFVVGLSLRGLSKTFGKRKVVQDISADFYEGQITALLGHNGAAKTTTMNMLTGILEPTKGDVRIYGRPLSSCTHLIGICSQHEALFHYMTVLEHMRFYGSIKSNRDKKELDYEIEQLLREVDLWHVQDNRISQLSGGMRRRLCVALAFVGGSTAIILDEPTSGVDPHGRRCIWNLIQKRKNRCTVLLSTHHLDEADMIGDRVAIMHEGRLMCCGSPVFLKHKLGSGYNLKLDKQDKSCDVEGLMSTIRSWIPGAQLVENVGSEVTIMLPVLSSTMDRLYRCLYDLDQNSSKLGIGNYGIYDTTLEEVFMKVCDACNSNLSLTEETAKTIAGKFVARKTAVALDTTENTPQNGSNVDMRGAGGDPRQRMTSGSHKLQQFSALMVKRFHHYRRNWKIFLSIILFPLIFVAAAFGFMTIRPQGTEAPSLLLTPAMYGPNSYTFFKNTANTPIGQGLVNHLTSAPGLGTTCMEGMNPGSDNTVRSKQKMSPYVCQKGNSSFFTPDNKHTSQGNCTCTEYKNVCETPSSAVPVPQIVTDTTEIILDLRGHDVSEYIVNTDSKFKYDRYGGWTVENDGTRTKAKVWFNNRGYHALPAFYNAYSNSLLRAMVPPSQAAEYGITAYNHPVMMSKQQLTRDTVLQSAADLGIAAVLLTALSFLPVGFLIYIVTEYSSKERQLEMVSGVGAFMYWITSLLWDFLMFCFTTALIVVIMAIFQQNVYWARDNLAGSVVLILLYGWATIPAMYCTAKFYRDATSAYMVLFCSNVFVGVITTAIIFILNFFISQEGVKEAHDIVKYVFLMFPQYCLAEGFIQLTSNQIQSEILARFGEDVYVSPFSFDLLLWNYIALAIIGFIAIIMLFIMEIKFSRKKRLPADSIEDNVGRDSEEVNNERQRVVTGYARDDVLVANRLSKVYERNNKDFLAVNRACFGVPKGECFGLLGVNGAGKTTTFRMLTGDLQPSDGSAFINQRKVGQSSVNMGRNVGYCPQDNALDVYLTGRELLYCHAKLRGIPSHCRKMAVENLIKKLKIDYADRTVHTYSGGMKRTLSTAVALLGEPAVVFLDEPTTGLDPVAKRLVWECILEAVRNNQSVVLTSHSMEECDALCTRLAIMVNGEFCCLGSPQFLKNKYGDGYTVVLHISGLSTLKYAISEFFDTVFPQAIIREQHSGALQIDIPKMSTSVADIIKNLESEKDKLGITHYSVSQTTLDNVFLNFVRDQTDGTDGGDMSSGSGGSDIDSVTHLSEPFTNPTYAYMNPDYDYTGENFGTKQSSFLMSTPEKTPKHIPEFSTKL